MSLPTLWPHPALREYWENGTHQQEGATQPHLQALLYQLVCALNAQHVVELGVWKGATSRWLACAVAANGGGTLTLVDIDAGLLASAQERITRLNLPTVAVRTMNARSMDAIEEIGTHTQFVFLDDDKADVTAKVELLRERGIHAVVAIHDAEVVPKDMEKLHAVVLVVPAEPSGGNLGLVSI